MANPQPNTTFSVSSGAVCFGHLHNIWSGSLVPVQQFPTIRPKLSGTVKVHDIEFNIAARNGTWNAYQLTEGRRVTGWFVCHADVDCNDEARKILRVAGSPYEGDSGSSMNNDDTAANHIFVINRYDWGYYSQQFQEDFQPDSEEDDDQAGGYEAAGLIDLGHAQHQARVWKNQKSHKRRSAEHGVWMHIPEGEYIFGRFGFDNTNAAAHSFLFFTADTQFTHTTFKGTSQTLR